MASTAPADHGQLFSGSISAREATSHHPVGIKEKANAETTVSQEKEMTLPIELGWIENETIPEPNTGCWLWLGRCDDWGYGWCRRKIRGVAFSRAHRAVWFALGGELPKGLVLDPWCRTKSCVNPAHLRLATHRQNALENSIGPAAINAGKERCPKCGGPYTLTVRRNRSAGFSRKCVPCDRAALKQWQRDNRGHWLASMKAWRERQKETC